MRRGLVLAVAVAAPIAAAAQVTELPDAALDGLMRITLASTAKAECPGATVNEAALQGAMLQVMTGLSGAGIDPVLAVGYLETPQAKAIFAAREADLRRRHGVAAEGYPALCRAISAETAADPDLGAMVRMK